MSATRYATTRAELSAVLDALGAPAYRTEQVWRGLWEQRRPLEELTVLPRALRAELAERLPLAFAPVEVLDADRGATRKWLWRAADGAQVETVLMLYRDRATVCISSQAGCAMGCTFCATGQAGFERHLDVGEIVEQVVRAQHGTDVRVSNVVFMGMGEPLANLDAVEPAIRVLHDAFGLSARHIVVSTVGIVPGIRRLADFELPVTLAVSLHAPNDALRETLVPVNRRYPIGAVLDAAREYAERKGRRVSFEYAVIPGVNDRDEHAEALAARLRGFRGGAHVNLIPLNPTAGFGAAGPDPRHVARFAARLRELGPTVSVRRNRGATIDAACGQLRNRVLASASAPATARMQP
ncbi:MAG TPA: 23S rRNA (adenine(2503)-C(2))-methyltransferase RlmN [Acidimicrobiia bacterium]|nr:23S rRNA (adenine(2503)-C(2))-methyltransferase RlmN [Acidimicrobiia bacterium]